MPKKVNRVVYGGNAEELRIDFGDKKIALKKGVVSIIKDPQIYQHLMDSKKTLHITDVTGIEDNYARKMKERLIKEG